MGKIAALGGTFDPLHKGHKALLRKAFKIADSVVIGLTSDEMAGKKSGRFILSYELRRRNLEGYIKRNFHRRARIVKLLDPYGPALSEKYDFLIVSPETYQGGEEINERRFETGLPPLKIIKVDYVRSKDGKVISSTRIKRGEIDKNGNPL